MNILTFNYEYPPLGGGGGVIHALLAETLAARHRVSVITSGCGGLPRQETRNGVEIHRVPVIGRRDMAVASLRSMLSYSPAAWVHALRLLRRQRFDVIHAYFAIPTGPGSVPCAKWAGVPHVLTILGGDVYDPSKRLSPHRIRPLRWTVGAVLRHSDAVVAESTDVQKHAYRHYDYRGSIEIIPLGIRKPAAPHASREELGLPGHASIAVTVGRLVARKRVEHLLQALVRPECREVHLVVVGSGPELPQLKDAAALAGIQDRVVFTGQVSEERKWQILHAADVYVSATMHEGFGLVYLEAMAAGLPVITYDVGGQVDFLEDGETGYLIPEGDQEALVAGIARAAAEPEEMARIGAANLKRSPRHSIEHCAAEYEALFERVRAKTSRNQSRTVTGF
jgi:glycosyltransferase involved in cell wall biosynthesis